MRVIGAQPTAGKAAAASTCVVFRVEVEILRGGQDL